ncbi:MAG: hypothetical protein O2794_02750 [bacterium]|nr:hypothetical protein [bacterium]
MNRTLLLFNLAILFGSFSFVYAQNTATTTVPTATSTPIEYTPEEVEAIRVEFLERLGLPVDAPYSVLDLFRYPTQAVTTDPLNRVMGDLQMNVDSKNLSPGKTITISAHTDSVDKRLIDYTWYHNGKSVLSGVGSATYSLTLGPIGTLESLRLVAISPDKSVTKEISKDIYPARAHMTWFSDSKTPVWYRGKALLPPGSEINFAVVPEVQIGNARISPNALIYEWSINDGQFSKSPEVSGVGKNTFKAKITTVQNSEYKVTVRVRDQLRRVSHEEQIVVLSHLPEMHFYELDSLYGLITWRELQNAQLISGDTVAIQAEPFFLPFVDLSNIDYEWRINRNRIDNRDKKNRIFRFSTEEGSSGRQDIFLQYSNRSNILQRGGNGAIITVLEL